MSQVLLANFTDWLDECGAGYVTEELVNHAEAFLRWRADAPLESLDDDDIRTFLLDWCPRQLALPAEAAGAACEAMVEFSFFLGCMGRLRGGVERGRSLARVANTLEGAMRAAIADRSNCHTTKSLSEGDEGNTSDLPEVDLADLIVAMNSAPQEQHSTMLTEWRPGSTASERAGIVAALITDSNDARTRLVGLRLLGMFDTDVAEPYMRQLLDTAAAGHAAIWLLDRGLADGDTVGGFVTPAILVDILSQLVDHPDVLCEQFLGSHDPHRMLEFFWRHPAPETASVLDVLGRYLPDRVLAKQARKAGIKHQSWLANDSRR
ncbi:MULTISPECIES: hypothetical protein [unclassified Mycobacterium]|uniref:hypothetical protein n=1 Tax=unclassified Mycobacterium TaxID=2642494 RepID=UPI0029C60ECF|nr:MULTISPECIES: hypothetical protein [unclassified Mycobacterium]